jgi:hypothetical protein
MAGILIVAALAATKINEHREKRKKTSDSPFMRSKKRSKNTKSSPRDLNALPPSGGDFEASPPPYQIDGSNNLPQYTSTQIPIPPRNPRRLRQKSTDALVTSRESTQIATTARDVDRRNSFSSSVILLDDSGSIYEQHSELKSVHAL